MLKAVLAEIDRQEKLQAHYNSIATARLAHIVVSAAGGKSAASSFKVENMLTFSTTEIFGRSDNDCTPRTRSILKKLIKEQRLPVILLTALKDDIRE